MESKRATDYFLLYLAHKASYEAIAEHQLRFFACCLLSPTRKAAIGRSKRGMDGFLCKGDQFCRVFCLMTSHSLSQKSISLNFSIMNVLYVSEKVCNLLFMSCPVATQNHLLRLLGD